MVTFANAEGNTQWKQLVGRPKAKEAVSVSEGRANLCGVVRRWEAGGSLLMIEEVQGDITLKMKWEVTAERRNTRLR